MHPQAVLSRMNNVIWSLIYLNTAHQHTYQMLCYKHYDQFVSEISINRLMMDCVMDCFLLHWIYLITGIPEITVLMHKVRGKKLLLSGSPHCFSSSISIFCLT